MYVLRQTWRRLHVETPVAFVRTKLYHSTPVGRYADEQLDMQRPAPLGPFASMEALMQSRVFWDGMPRRMGNSFQRFQLETTTKRR